MGARAPVYLYIETRQQTVCSCQQWLFSKMLCDQQCLVERKERIVIMPLHLFDFTEKQLSVTLKNGAPVR